MGLNGRQAPLTAVFVGSLVLVGLLLLGIGAFMMVGQGGVPAGATPVRPVIPPGREAKVMELLEPLSRQGFLGFRPGDVQISRAEVRVGLRGPGGTEGGRCEAPGWVEPPGGLLVTYFPRGDGPTSPASRSHGGLSLTWFLCDDEAPEPGSPEAAAARLVEQMAARDPEQVWGIPFQGVRGFEVGLLTPLVRPTGLTPGHALVIVWAVALLASLGAFFAIGRRRRDRGTEARGETAARGKEAWADPGRPSWGAWRLLPWLILAAGALWRVTASTSLPFDVDERWAAPLASPVFNDDHDAWVHPPVFRSMQQIYTLLVGWSDGDPIWLLRLPSTLCGIAVLGLLAVAVRLLRRPGWAAVLLAVAAFAPAVVKASVLARPYALASLLVVLVAFALWVRLPRGAGGGTGREVALRWLVALVAGGLAVWTDLVAGIAAVVLLAAGAAGAWRTWRLGPRVAVVAAVVLWCAPLVPGGLDAVQHQVLPSEDGLDAPSREGPDLRPRHDSPVAAASELASFTFLGTMELGPAAGALGLLAAIVLALGSVRSRSGLGAGLVVILVALIVVSGEVRLRPRNALFLPNLAGLALVVVLPGVLGIARAILRKGGS